MDVARLVKEQFGAPENLQVERILRGLLDQDARRGRSRQCLLQVMVQFLYRPALRCQRAQPRFGLAWRPVV